MKKRVVPVICVSLAIIFLVSLSGCAVSSNSPPTTNRSGQSNTQNINQSKESTRSQDSTEQTNATSAADFTIGANSNGVVISKYTGDSSDVVIPSSIGGSPVVNIGTGAFQDNTILECITIPDSVSNILHFAFSGCTSLVNVTLPEGVSIADNAFENCPSLSEESKEIILNISESRRNKLPDHIEVWDWVEAVRIEGEWENWRNFESIFQDNDGGEYFFIRDGVPYPYTLDLYGRGELPEDATGWLIAIRNAGITSSNGDLVYTIREGDIFPYYKGYRTTPSDVPLNSIYFPDEEGAFHEVNWMSFFM